MLLSAWRSRNVRLCELTGGEDMVTKLDPSFHAALTTDVTRLGNAKILLFAR